MTVCRSQRCLFAVRRNRCFWVARCISLVIRTTQEALLRGQPAKCEQIRDNLAPLFLASGQGECACSCATVRADHRRLLGRCGWQLANASLSLTGKCFGPAQLRRTTRASTCCSLPHSHSLLQALKLRKLSHYERKRETRRSSALRSPLANARSLARSLSHSQSQRRPRKLRRVILNYTTATCCSSARRH